MSAMHLRELICQDGQVRAYVDGRRRVATARRGEEPRCSRWVVSLAGCEKPIEASKEEIRELVRAACQVPVVFEPHVVRVRTAKRRRYPKSLPQASGLGQLDVSGIAMPALPPQRLATVGNSPLPLRH